MAQAQKPRVQLEYASPFDSAKYVKIAVDCFGKSTYTRNVYGGVDFVPKIIYKETDNYNVFKRPESHVIKAVDPTTNEPLGYARWGIPPAHGIERGSPKLTEGEAERVERIEVYTPNGVRKDLDKGVRKFVIEKRKQYMKEGDITLEVLGIDPAHQGKGIGTELIKWGMDIADKKGARIFLEATAAGCQLYLRHGWRIVEETKYDFSKDGGEGLWDLVLMIRDPDPVATQNGT